MSNEFFHQGDLLGGTNRLASGAQLGYLTNVTTGIDAAVDGSIIPQAFRLICPQFTWIYISQFTVYIEDNSGFGDNEYGSIPELANGITVWLRSVGNNPDIEITNGNPIKRTVQWGWLCDSAISDTVAGTQTKSVIYKWNIFDKNGENIRLLPGYQLEVTINDNLTALTAHHFLAQGARTAK